MMVYTFWLRFQCEFCLFHTEAQAAGTYSHQTHHHDWRLLRIKYSLWRFDEVDTVSRMDWTDWPRDKCGGHGMWWVLQAGLKRSLVFCCVTSPHLSWGFQRAHSSSLMTSEPLCEGHFSQLQHVWCATHQRPDREYVCDGLICRGIKIMVIWTAQMGGRSTTLNQINIHSW